MQALIQLCLSKRYVLLAMCLVTLAIYLAVLNVVVIVISLLAIFAQDAWDLKLLGGWFLLLHGVAVLGWTRPYWTRKQEAR